MCSRFTRATSGTSRRATPQATCPLRVWPRGDGGPAGSHNTGSVGSGDDGDRTLARRRKRVIQRTLLRGGRWGVFELSVPMHRASLRCPMHRCWIRKNGGDKAFRAARQRTRGHQRVPAGTGVDWIERPRTASSYERTGSRIRCEQPGRAVCWHSGSCMRGFSAAVAASPSPAPGSRPDGSAGVRP